LVEALPTYADNAESQLEELQAQLEELGIDDILPSLDFLDPSKLIDLISGFLGSLFGSLALVFLMLMFFVFMFLEASGFSVRLRKGLAPDSPLLTRFHEYTRDVREYWWITSAIAFVIAVLDVIFLLILGVDFAILWGVVAFLLSYIPSLGFWLALIPPFLLAWAEFGIATAMIVFIGYVLINGSIQNFVQPKVTGGGLNLSPLVVTISVVVWAWALGPIGAILAVPATMLVKKLFLERYEETRWLAIAIGEGRGRQDIANDDLGPGTGT
jgi:predicted PurR-regulated permease PerM